MTDTDLSALRELANQVLDGHKWFAHHALAGALEPDLSTDPEGDAAFVVACSPAAILALLDRLERRTALLREARSELAVALSKRGVDILAAIETCERIDAELATQGKAQ